MDKPLHASRRDVMRRSFVGGAALTAGLANFAPLSARADGVVDLQLALAVDASGSVNQVRFDLQKQGYVAAFRNPRVLQAIRSGSAGGIAVTMFQWTGPMMQIHAVPWAIVRDEASAEAFASMIDIAPRQIFGGGTSISGAIDYAVELMSRTTYTAGRMVIDVSGDGATNRGRSSYVARDDAVAKGFTINGLPILSIEPQLDRHYRDEVIGGVNAFMVVARSYEEFAEAILKKLITEISSIAPESTAVAG